MIGTPIPLVHWKKVGADLLLAVPTDHVKLGGNLTQDGVASLASTGLGTVASPNLKIGSPGTAAIGFYETTTAGSKTLGLTIGGEDVWEARCTPGAVGEKTSFKLALGTSINEFSTDGTMAGNSHNAVPTEAALVTYVGANTFWSRVGAGITQKTANDYLLLKTSNQVDTNLITFQSTHSAVNITGMRWNSFAGALVFDVYYYQSGASTGNWQLWDNSVGADFAAIDVEQVTGKVTIQGSLKTNSTESSVSTVSGCGVFPGGVGIGGDEYLGGKLSVAGGTFGTTCKLSVCAHTTVDNNTAAQISANADGNHALVLSAFSATQSADILEVQRHDGTIVLAIGARGALTVTPLASTTGTPTTGITLNVGAHTSITSGLDYQSFHLNGAVTQNFIGGNKATQRFALITAPTYSATTTTTITTAATLSITGAPVAGGSTTITNSYALWVQGGKSRFAGSIDIADVAYSWPNSQGASSSILENDGSGGLSWNQTVEQWRATPPASPTDLGIKGQMNYDGTSLHFCYNPDSWLSINATLSPLFTASGAADRVAIWTGPNTLTSSANLTWNSTTFGVGSTQSSISTVTGCAVFAGGIGVSENGYFGGRVHISSANAGTVSKLSINAHAIIDNEAAVQISTGGVANHALVLQAVASQTGNILEIHDSAGVNLWAVGPRGGVTITPTPYTSGAPIIGFQLNVANHTSITAGLDYQSFHVNGAVTQQFATGAKTNQRFALISAPTYSAVGASVTTTAATLAISGAPSAGANMTITNAYALWVQAGKSRFAGSIDIADVAYAWPTSQGTANSILQNDGSGNLSWAPVTEQVVAVPANQSSPGIAGHVAYDDNYKYECKVANTWIRMTIESVFTT